MKKRLTGMMTVQALGLALACSAFADPVDEPLVVETDDGPIEMVTVVAAPAYLEGALTTVYSGWLYHEDDTRALQQDDFDNPSALAAEAGQELWDAKLGANGESCVACHNDPASSMKGLRAVTPRVDAASGKLMIVEDYINGCVTEKMGLEKWGVTSTEMKNMLTLIALQSRGEPVNVAVDGAAAPFWELGKEIYYTRYGQLEMACSNCHEDNAGNYIRADHLSQGQINGMPTYRMKDQGIVSAQQRFVGCVRDTRAETFKAGSDEFKALELYVASRGNGLSVEGITVRP